MDNIIFGAIVASLMLLAVPCHANTAINDSAITIDSPIKGHWIVDPRQPGDSLPPVGRSLFDFVFSKTVDGQTVYDIPYPYSKLITRLEKLVQQDKLLESSVKQVLVPLGRSLARNIARPDFFRFPRVVSVVDTEPRYQSTNPGLMLKDRLYIGYGEAAEILEIISYNEAAGRFEFQIVTNYSENGKPEVFYASREVCSACHQNGALIFSRQQWDETNSNPRIAALLEEHQAQFYGIPVNRGVDIPFAIDAATDRANLFALYQLLWQQGCEAAGNSNSIQPIKCRENLFTYTLQYLLSNRNVFDSHSNSYRNKFLPQLTDNWNYHWPDGFLIPDPDIPNRDPLLIKTNMTTVNRVTTDNFSDLTSTTLNTMLAKNDVPDKFEPLNFRPPLEKWSTNTKGIDKTLISGLAGFIPNSDMKHLDQQLSSTKNIANSKLKLTCTIFNNDSNKNGNQTKFKCNSADDGLFLKGRFSLNNNKWITGKVSKLSAGKQAQFDLVLKAIKIQQNNKRTTALLQIYSSNDFSRKSNLLAARLPDGNSIASFELSWDRKKVESKNTAILTIRHDFDLIKKAITELANHTASHKSDVFANKPFRRASIMKALLEELGFKSNSWCCVESDHMPIAKLQDPDKEVSIVSQAANPEIAPFYHYCSVCHRTSNRQPPNFLQGDEFQVTQNIKQCAERIYYRLSMWQQQRENRSKSPMPPATALHKLGFTQRNWSSSDELSSLKHAVTKLIYKKTGNKPDLDQYVKSGFDNLPGCLPQN